MILIVSGILLVALILGLLRSMLGPTLADRLLATQLVSTVGVALLALWASGGYPALLDAAMVLSLLTAVSIVALARSATRNV